MNQQINIHTKVNNAKDKVGQRIPPFQLKIGTGIRECSTSTSLHLRLAKSGDITRKLNKQNNKLRKNIEDLNLLIDGSSPVGNMEKVLNLNSLKYHKQREKGKEKENLLEEIYEEINKFGQWWERRREEQKLVKKEVENKRGQKNPKEFQISKLKFIFASIQHYFSQQSPSSSKHFQPLSQPTVNKDQLEFENNLLKSAIASLSKYFSSTNGSPTIFPQQRKFNFTHEEKNVSLQETMNKMVEVKEENELLEGQVKKLEEQLSSLSSKMKENVIEVDSGEEEKSSNNEIRVLELEKEQIIEELKELKKEKELQSEFLKNKLYEFESQFKQMESDKINELELKYKKIIGQRPNINQTEEYVQLQNICQQKQKIIKTLTKITQQLEAEVNNGVKKCQDKEDQIEILKRKILEKEDKIQTLELKIEFAESQKGKELETKIAADSSITFFKQKKSQLVLNQSDSEPSEANLSHLQIMEEVQMKIQKVKSKFSSKEEVKTQNDDPQLSKEKEVRILEQIYSAAEESLQGYSKLILTYEQTKKELSAMLKEINIANEYLGVSQKDKKSLVEAIQKKVEEEVSKNNFKHKQTLNKIMSQISTINMGINNFEQEMTRNDKILQAVIQTQTFPSNMIETIVQLEDKIIKNDKALSFCSDCISMIIAMLNEEIISGGVNIEKVNKYLIQLQNNIKEMQKKKISMKVGIESEKERTKEIQSAFMEQIKILKEDYEKTFVYLEEAYYRIKGQKNQKFVLELQNQFEFKGNKIQQTEVETQTHYSVLDVIIEELMNGHLCQSDLWKLKEVIQNAKSLQFKMNYEFLEEKKYFLLLYLEEPEEQIQQYKLLLSQHMLLNEIQSLFDQSKGSQQIIQTFKAKIHQLEHEKSILESQKTNQYQQWIKKAQKKYFPLSSELSDEFQKHVLQLVKAEREEEYLKGIDDIFGQFRRQEQAFNKKLIWKDEVFKHHASVINKICKRKIIKEEQEIKKSMIMGESNMFRSFMVKNKQEKSI